MNKYILAALFTAFLTGIPSIGFGMACNVYVEQQADIALNGDGDLDKLLEHEDRSNMASSLFSDVEKRYSLGMVDSALCLADGIQRSTCKYYPGSYLCFSDYAKPEGKYIANK